MENGIFKLLELDESMSLHDFAEKMGQKPKEMLDTIHSLGIPYEIKKETV